MTATWGPRIKNIQDQIVTQVAAQWADDKTGLTAPLNAELDVLAAIEPDARALKPVSIHVWPPTGTIDVMASAHFDGKLSFPVLVRVSGLARSNILTVLREAVGLVVDGYARDTRLNELVADPDTPAVVLGEPQGDAGFMVQEITINVEAIP